MKCPKCEYLGYETGVRCRHCGYEFTLLGSTPEPGDLVLHDAGRQTPVSTTWLDQFVLDGSGAPSSVTAAVPAAPGAPAASVTGSTLSLDRTASAASAALPLFSRGLAADEQPLIRLPAAPRAPLAVRRTPDTPRLRAVKKAVPQRAEPEPALDFRGQDGDVAGEEDPTSAAAAALPDPSRARRSAPPAIAVSAGDPGGGAARLLAALLDHALLLAIDAAVLYFTLRMTSLSPPEWALLPALPIAFFLGLIKIGYFAAFTAIGGQTIGKMAAGLTVVTDGGRSLDAGRALKRALLGAVSLLAGGLGFLPAVVAADRRALHDRVAGTRVVVRTAHTS